MVLDTSALLALLLDEPEAEDFRRAVEEDATRLVSAATLLETAIVIEARKGEAAGRELDLLMHKAGVEIVPVDVEQAAEARRAYRRYGRGRIWRDSILAMSLPTHSLARRVSPCYSRVRTSPERMFIADDVRTDAIVSIPRSQTRATCARRLPCALWALSSTFANGEQARCGCARTSRRRTTPAWPSAGRPSSWWRCA